MPQTKIGIRTFIASSSDVEKERGLVKNIAKKLDNRYDRWGLDIQVDSWEDNVIPNIGMDPQDVINRQIRFDFVDIFIGIVWRRVGTPTPRALSGTIEETNRAMAARDSTGRPWFIMFFLCDRPFEPTTQDEKYQYQEALKFRNWLEKRSLCKHYENDSDFCDKVENSFASAVDEFIRNQQYTQLPQVPQPAPLIIEPINPFNVRIWCPWCRNLGPITVMPNNVYQLYRGQVWPCPRCGGPQVFP